jgi:hypothetical protein
MNSETQRALGLVTGLLSDRPDLAVLADSEAWGLVRNQSKQLGVAPLIAYIVRPHVSGPDREWCDAILTRSWTRHENSLRHLRFVLGVLNDAGIETLSLKGPLLAQRYYNPPFLRRPSVDLDIAVRARDLQRACEALVRSGYVRTRSLEEDLACSHHVELTHPGRKAVELHFRASHGLLGVLVDEFFDRSLACAIPGGGMARVPGPADEILQLVLHLAKDRYKPIFHLYEIRRLWRATSPAIREEVISRAASHHFQGVIALTEVAFRVRWGEPFLPPDSPHLLAIKRGTWLHRKYDERLYTAFESASAEGLEHRPGDRVRGRWLQFQITDRPIDAVRLLGLLGRIAWFQMRHRRSPHTAAR